MVFANKRLSRLNESVPSKNRISMKRFTKKRLGRILKKFISSKFQHSFTFCQYLSLYRNQFIKHRMEIYSNDYVINLYIHNFLIHFRKKKNESLFNCERLSQRKYFFVTCSCGFGFPAQSNRIGLNSILCYLFDPTFSGKSLRVFYDFPPIHVVKCLVMNSLELRVILYLSVYTNIKNEVSHTNIEHTQFYSLLMISKRTTKQMCGAKYRNFSRNI